MASPKIHTEIEEVRSRIAHQRWDAMSNDVGERLRRLKDLIGTDKTNELHRHVIVSAVAALETFHRGTIIAIIEAGDIYRKRAAEGIQEKFSMSDALEWITSKSVTFAELVAHTAKLSSIDFVVSIFSRLLKIDIKQALQDATSPMERRSPLEERTKIVDDVDALLANLAKGYRFRHIFAHEAASSVNIGEAECTEIYSAISVWVDAVDAVLWATIYADYPITTSEMIQHASRELEAARNLLARVMKVALRNSRKTGSRGWLRKNHFRWMASIDDWIEGSYEGKQGTMWRPIARSEEASAIRARAEMIREWDATTDPENSNDEKP